MSVSLLLLQWQHHSFLCSIQSTRSFSLVDSQENAPFDDIPYSAKFSRHKIFMDCHFQALWGNNFRESRVPRTGIRYSEKNSRSLLFTVAADPRKPRKLSALKIWRYTVYSNEYNILTYRGNIWRYCINPLLVFPTSGGQLHLKCNANHETDDQTKSSS